MSLNATPQGDRIHIGIFGRRNAGKSSLINAITNQNIAIVSDVKGTTTDPVYKNMELLPLGPVTIIDTPGIDDEGDLGAMRVKASYQVLNKTDIAVVVIDGSNISEPDNSIIEKIKDKKIPYVVVYNKADIYGNIEVSAENEIAVSSAKGTNINELRELIAKQFKTDGESKKIISDKLNPNDFVVLVVPIDESAPKGRLILPQQQTVRDIIDHHANAIVVQDTELAQTLAYLGKKPAVVITDSQAFGKVAKIVPKDMLLTSFSILMARYKGNLEQAVAGVTALDRLEDGDTVLISEGCTHHRQCGDIGTVKLPNWIRNYTGKDVKFEFTSGTEFHEDLTKYKLIVHCGGCMLNEREMKYRLRTAEEQGVPMTNYGILIAYVHGILKRSVEIFPEIAELLK
ncbi:MAG: [FeFe] hydrogenase H-cluster maturation GTPase HydF [Ruminococcaceae bacterium]|nr:[FeFe] hydrogenase H-cluster maturation GTPase HydF [Oscillospiraceae bacterium]